MNTYMSDHQDRSRNALAKAAEASFLAWCEELKADQAQFMSEKILKLGRFSSDLVLDSFLWQFLSYAWCITV